MDLELKRGPGRPPKDPPLTLPVTSPSVSGRKVERAQFHVGFGHNARTGCDMVRDQAEMHVTPAGIHIRRADGEWLVPYSNVTWAKLL